MSNVMLILRSSRWPDWKQAIFEIIFSIVGGFFPIYAGALFVRIFGSWSGWYSFFNKGELVIYSATYLASALFIKAKTRIDSLKHEEKDLIDERNIHSSMYTIIFPVFGLLISSIMFASVMTRDLLSLTSKFDNIFFMFTSLILFGVSILIYFLINVFDIIRNNVDPTKLKSIMESDLEKKVKTLRGERHE